VPRTRSARVAALGSPVRRAVAPRYSSRTSGPLRRRLVVGLLVLASLAMITVYFRESPNGALHDFQSTASSALRPFEIAANRVARPFQDAYNWTADIFHAKSENEKLRQEVKDLRQQAIQASGAIEERDSLRRLLKAKRSRAYEDFAGTAVTAEVMSNPASQFDQTMVIAAGHTDGIRVYDAVITDRGLVGQVAKVLRDTALVTLLTDKESAVTAKDDQTGAIGIVRHSQGPEDLLFLDHVFKNKVVNRGDRVVTAGLQSGKKLSSFYPRGIPIGQVTKVGQTDVDPFQDVQVMPFVDFTSLDVVLVLASKEPRPQMP
jgi:rod shape-determining protein MreC